MAQELARSTTFARLFGVWLGLSAAACAGSAGPPAAPQAQAAPAPAAADAPPIAQGPATLDDSTRLTTLSVSERPELGAELAAEGVEGVIALFDSAERHVVCSDAKRCTTPHLPASTFKIPNSIIAFETGVVSDTEMMLKWDGTQRSVPEWNQDMTLRRAIQVSCVPCYQWIARNIGESRMTEWLGRLEYGNQDISGGIDRFWLVGGLRMTPVEQLDFLRRLDLGRLPIQPATRDNVIELITLDVTDVYVLRGKTGAAMGPEDPENILWFVGWVERDARRVYFATALDRFPPNVDLKVRRRITERVLTRLGVLPG